MMTTLVCAAILSLAAPPGALDDALGVLEELDAVRVTMRMDEVPASEALAAIGRMLSATVRADWSALTRLGVYADSEVTLHLDEARASSALAALTAQLGDEFGRPTYEAHAGQIVLTTRESIAEMALPAVYDVRDLLLEDVVIEVEEQLEIPPIPPDAEPIEETKGEGGNVESESVRVILLTPQERLMGMILDHVDPEGWLAYGGSQARMDVHGESLLVTAPPSVHRGVRHVLRQLRAANPTSITLDAAIIDLPADVLKQLRRRHPDGRSALAMELLHGGVGTELWFMYTTTAIGETLRITSEDSGVSIIFELGVTHDPRTGHLRFEVGTETTLDADIRKIETTVVMNGQQQAAVIDLPAASGRSEMVRVLVLYPRRN